MNHIIYRHRENSEQRGKLLLTNCPESLRRLHGGRALVGFALGHHKPALGSVTRVSGVQKTELILDERRLGPVTALRRGCGRSGIYGDAGEGWLGRRHPATACKAASRSLSCLIINLLRNLAQLPENEVCGIQAPRRRALPVPLCPGFARNPFENTSPCEQLVCLFSNTCIPALRPLRRAEKILIEMQAFVSIVKLICF